MNRFLLRFVALLMGGAITLDLASRLGLEILWFREVGYSSVFWLRSLTQLSLWAIALIGSAGFLGLNLALAQRLQYPATTDPMLPTPAQQPLRFRSLLLIILGLNLLISLLVLNYGQAAYQYWQPDRLLQGGWLGQTSELVALPQRLQPQVIWAMLTRLPSQPWELAACVGIGLALTIAPRFWLRVFAVLLSLSWGMVIVGQWHRCLQALHPVAFQIADPLFHRDISFFLFTLPLWRLLGFWLMGLTLYALLSVALLYLRSGDSLNQGKFPGWTLPQMRHLAGLLGCWMLAVSLSYWLSRYELLYSTEGVVYSASFTEVTVKLPAYTGLSWLALGLVLWWGGYALLGPRFRSRSRQPQIAGLWLGLVGYAVIAVIAEWVIPGLVQRLIVQPNELGRERPYIERTIQMTRQAFDLDAIAVQTFRPTEDLTAADLRENDLTIRNIRLWDTRPLLETNRQLQQIRPYYRFLNADIDRYTLARSPERTSKTDPDSPEKRQVLIAARELDTASIPAEAQTWVNQHLIYTHGYGFTVSPVNRVGPGGLPDYFIKDIDAAPKNPVIRASFPIDNPRIYYGELTNTYVMTQTRLQELDYPSGSENVYNVYEGRGGIRIGSFWRRLLLAINLRDWQMMLTQDFTEQTRLLLRRNVVQRVKAIAPFLHYDSEPYLVVADINPGTSGKTAAKNDLYWILDAYTTSDLYPYSDPDQNSFNYIRNSVKVVIDAYHGSVNFYITNTDDPLIQSWNQVFPGWLKPLSAMPAALQAHIRYPIDYYRVQAQQLMVYHMTDPQVFYNREDPWRAPTEIYDNKPRLVEPYFLIMKLPTEQTEEFVLFLPFAPIQRNNLVAWLAARSDGGNYGKLLLYLFPKQELVYGLEQIEARINQDPVISEQISLWNRQGSRAIQGNLLVIPIEQSILYVEPLYLEAEQGGLPTFVRVIVAFENRIVMAETLDQALNAIFQPETTPEPAIVRPVQ